MDEAAGNGGTLKAAIRLLAWSLVVVTWILPAAAEPGGELDTLELGAKTLTLRPGARLRLSIESRVDEGIYVRADSAWIYLDANGEEARAGRGAIDGVWEEGDASRRWAIFFAVPCGIWAATLAGAGFNLHDTRTTGERIGAIFWGGLIGAGIGGLTGSLIGSLIPQWHQRYP